MGAFVRAVRVTIHNVRSIHDADIFVEEISLIAGANNSGKSNVIDAIRMFYSDLKWTDERDSPVVAGSDSESWVEIEFEPSLEELTQLKDEYKSAGGTFRVRNYFKSGVGADGKARAGYYAYVDGVLSETLFYGAKNVGSAKVGKIVYIPAVSRVDEHTKLSGPSALRDLVATVMTKVVSKSPAYERLTKAFIAFETDIKTHESADGQSLSALEGEITDEISDWATTFSLGIQGVQPDEMVKSLIKPQLFDTTHGGEVDQTRFGAGFQRHLIYVLIKLAAKYASASKPPAGEKKEFLPELTWILFEEPEAFLHPSQEDVLYDSLAKLTEDQSTQVLVTTHSSRFVSRSVDDLTRLIRLRRDKSITSAHQVDQIALDGFFEAALLADAEITPALIEAKDLDASTVMSALKLELWLQPHRASSFFASRVVLVEGPSEVGLYSYLNNRGHMKAPAPGIVLVDCMGKYNIHRFVALLGAFGVDHVVLYDGDNGGSQDAEVTSTIEAASGEFTKSVIRFEKDLESELGIAPLPRHQSHKKPQYVLYNLEAGLVEKARLDAVIEVFRKLATSSTSNTESVRRYD